MRRNNRGIYNASIFDGFIVVQQLCWIIIVNNNPKISETNREPNQYYCPYFNILQLYLFIISIKSKVLMKKKISLLTKQLTKYEKEVEQENTDWQKWILTQKEGSNKYVAYAYKLHSHPDSIKKSLKRQINSFMKIEQSAFSSVEQAFFTFIEPHYYFVVTRKYRISRTFADILNDPQKKKSLNILNIAKNIAKSFSLLQKREITHNNLAIDKIEYFQTNVIIELPLFRTIHNQQTLLKTAIKQNNLKCEQVDLQKLLKTRDIQTFLQILQRLSTQRKINLINSESNQSQKQTLINEIEQPIIKKLFNHIFLEKNQQNQSIQVMSFQQISYFLQNERYFSYDQISKQRQLVDILKLSLLPSKQNTICRFDQPKNEQNNSQSILTISIQNYRLEIRIYQNNLYFFVNSQLNPELFFTTVINNRYKLFPFFKYFNSIESFASFITNRNSHNFQITDSASLALIIPKKQAMVLESKLALQTYQRQSSKNNYPINIIGSMHLNKNTLEKAFLINPSVALTSANQIYNKSNNQFTNEKKQFISNSNQQFLINNSYVSNDYQKCEESNSWKHNLCIVKLQQQFKSLQYPTLLYDYNQSEMINLLQKARHDQPLQYYINGVYYSPNDIHVKNDSIVNLSKSIEKGTPVFVSIGKRMAVIGMKTDQTKALLFNRQHVSNIYYMLINVLKRDQILNTHIYPAALFNFKEVRSDEISPQFRLNQIINNQQITDTWIFLEKEVEKPTIYSKDKLNHYNILLKLYQTYFSPTHWKISLILMNIALVYKQLANYVEAEKIIRKAIYQEQIFGRWNQYLLVQLYFYLAQILQKQQKYDEAGVQYETTISLAEKVRLFKILGKCYHNMAVTEKVRGQREQSYKWFSLSVKIKEKFSDKQDMIISLRECVLMAIQLGKIAQAGENVERMVKMVQKQNQRLKKIVDNIWTVFSTKIDENEQQDASALKTRNRIRRKYYKQQLQD